MATKAERLAALEETVVPFDKAQYFFKGVVYGPKGVGKTIESLTLANLILPEDKKIFYVDATEGWVSAKDPEFVSLLDRGERIEYAGKSQIETLTEAIVDGYGKFADCGVLIFDEYSTMATGDLDVVTEATSSQNNKGLTESSSSWKNPDEAKWPDMNINTTRMRKITWPLARLKCHVIFVCHERKDEKEGLLATPSFMPKFRENLGEKIHVIARMTKKNSEGRMLQVQPSGGVEAKCRIGSLPDKVSPDDFNKRVVEWLSTRNEETSISVDVD